MADTKISAMTADASPTSDDLVVTVNDPSGTPANKKVTMANLAAFVIASDAEVAALAGLTSAADKLPYFTGSGTASVTAFTAAGRALVDDADAATQRTTLGLAIGTNVQAFDTELAALAGLTSAADKLPYFTGSGTASVADFTSAGRALVDDADAAAQRTTLGLGTAALKAYTETTETDLGALTWTGTTPTTLIAAKYKAVQIGNMINLYWRIEYTSNGGTSTVVQFALPTTAPLDWTGQGNENAWAGTGWFGTSTTGSSSTRTTLFKNGSADYQIKQEGAAGAYILATGFISYMIT